MRTRQLAARSAPIFLLSDGRANLARSQRIAAPGPAACTRL